MIPSLTAMSWEHIVEFNDRFFPGWRDTEPVYLSNALAGEVGEICNDVKHLIGGGTNRRPITKAHLAEELADAYIYMVIFLETLGFDEAAFGDVILQKIQINAERMAPPSVGKDARSAREPSDTTAKSPPAKSDMSPP